MRGQKRSITLLEIMIALTLAGILLAVVFNTYRHITLSHIKLEKAKVEVLANKMISQRLITMLSNLNIDRPSTQDKKTESTSPLYTLSLPESAYLTLNIEHDNGTDPDPSFCHHVKSVLFLSRHHQLCLVTYSSNGEQRKEVFKENISEMKLQFFDPSEKEWMPSWDYNNKKLPPMLKLSLFSKQKEPPLEFAFFIPEGEDEVVYKRGVP
jgi:Tfp pilus assembly protein PilE